MGKPEVKALVYIEDVSYLESKDAYISAYEALPQHRKDIADRLIFDKDKRLSIGAWTLLKRGLKEQGIEEVPEIAIGEHGKPFFKDSNLFFNLSHSGTKVMCILSDCECGCDIEEIRDIKERIAERFFEASETDRIQSKEDFFRIWTMKESYIKMKGTGLSEGLKTFSVVKGVPGYEFHEFEVNGYAAGCCVPFGCETMEKCQNGA